MQRPEPFLDYGEPFQPGHRFEQRRRNRPRGNGQPRARIALDQMGQETSRQHGVADTGRGDKQDVHFADPRALYPGSAQLLAKKAILAYLYPAMANASFALLEDRAVLAVSGPDRRAFLQGSRLKRCRQGRAGCRAIRRAPDRTGQIPARLYHGRGGRIAWLDAEAGRLADLRRRLAVYRLRAKVSLDERARSCRGRGVWRRCVRRCSTCSGNPGAAQPLDLGVALVDPRLAALGARAILPRETARATLDAIGLAEIGFDAYDRLRLSLGVPDGSRDLVLEKSILLESGFDELNGIDWQKGCYIGQELTARTKYRGLIKKRLMPVRIDGPAPSPGTARAVRRARGRRNAVEPRGLGLALLRIEPALEGKRLRAENAVVIPVKPDWMCLEGERQS